MPINAGPEYFAAEMKFLEAKSAQEKIKYLQDMLRLLPKHKGTENVRASLRKRMAKLKTESSKSKKLGKKRIGIEKEGAGQICIIGMANSGKSQLLKSLTGVGSPTYYPYSTKEPAVGMMLFEDVRIQLIEIPSSLEPEHLSIAHNSDGVLCLVDLTNLNEDLKKLHDIVNEHDLPNPLWVGSKFDEAPCSKDICVSAKTGKNLEQLKKIIWSKLGMIRVYTKSIGKQPEAKPLTLPLGSTVKDVAENVHKDMIKNFKFARIWGSAKFSGAHVGLGYVLKDRDIVEIHTE